MNNIEDTGPEMVGKEEYLDRLRAECRRLRAENVALTVMHNAAVAASKYDTKKREELEEQIATMGWSLETARNRAEGF